ncbi:MAG: DNA repair protein RecO [Planctomycetes bacterium]|nr:DNA repair protein RecO [Planctomycetota bacterium]
MGAPRGYRTVAIVVRTVDFAETSQVVHLVTPEHGLVPALAKGARAHKGAFQGGVPLGVLGEADLLPRRGAELELLRSFRVTDGLRGLRDDVDRFAAGCYVLALLRDLARPALGNEALFLAGATALKAVASAPPPAAGTWVAVFEARALSATGHRPHLDPCPVCETEVGRDALFSPVAGGVVHRRCAPEGPVRPVSPADREVLARLYTARLPSFAAEPLGPAALRAARGVHDLFLPWVLEREPAGRRALA